MLQKLVLSHPQLLRILGANDRSVTKLASVTTGTRTNSVRSFDRK
jgi:hypothetical protein